jgi:hypothetical protein
MNQKILIPVLAAVVAGAAFFMLVLKPKRQEAAGLKTKIAEQQTALTGARQLLAANQQARETYREAYSTVVRLGKAVPADDDVRSLVVQLDSAAKATHVDFQSIDVSGGAGGGAAPAEGTNTGASLPPGATVGPAGFPVMPFTFAFNGSFFNLGDFFQRLEGFVRERNKGLSVTGRLLTLDTLELQPDATGFPHIQATVGATSYLVSPLEGATGGATASGPAAAGATGATAPNSATPAQPAGSGSAPAPTTATSTGALR